MSDDFILGCLVGAAAILLLWSWHLESIARHLDRVTKPKTKGKL